MDIRTTEFGGKLRTDDTAAYVERKLNGSDYERGQIEELEAGLNNSHKALGRLITLLAQKDLLTAPEITEIVQGYQDTEADFV